MPHGVTLCMASCLPESDTRSITGLHHRETARETKEMEKGSCGEEKCLENYAFGLLLRSPIHFFSSREGGSCNRAKSTPSTPASEKFALEKSCAAHAKPTRKQLKPVSCTRDTGKHFAYSQDNEHPMYFSDALRGKLDA